MGDENHCKVFSISVIGDHTPLLDAVADNPQGIELSLKDSAGVDSKIKTVNLDGKTYKLQFFDFSVRRQFRFLPSRFKQYAKIIVYDATAMKSFNTVEMWLDGNPIPANGTACVLLVGNDHDLDDNDENKVVKTINGEGLARRFNIPFIETSAEHPAEMEQALRNMTEFINSYKIYKTGAIQKEG